MVGGKLPSYSPTLDETLLVGTFFSLACVYTLHPGADTLHLNEKWVGQIIGSCSFSAWHVFVSTVCMQESLYGLVCITSSCCKTTP